MSLLVLVATAIIFLLTLVSGDLVLLETRLAGYLFLFSQTLIVWLLWSQAALAATPHTPSQLGHYFALHYDLNCF